MTDYDIVPTNLDLPLRPFLKQTINPLSTSVFKNYIREISEVRINSNKNLFFGSFQQERGYHVHQLREEVDLRKVHSIVPEKFAEMSIITSEKTKVYFRNYKKLIEVIIQIGGFFYSITNLAILILFIYSNNKILWKCISCTISNFEIEENISRSNIMKNINIEKDNNNNNNENKGDVINVHKALQEERSNQHILDQNNNQNHEMKNLNNQE